MNEDEVEGVAIANLIGADMRSVVGWVYRWNTGALAVRWDVSGPQRVSGVQPDLKNAEKREIDFEGLKRIRRRSRG
ncbi:hypothetical protein [Aliiroseovarius sp. YM-037]|uniref:hypothetical protein n=1 Tax=Aliiroseovarius sp. YM-037 TaxID=3341728 RepID=UPI003A80DA53